MNRLDSELPAGTYTISEFAWEMKGLLADAYPSVWVAGEVRGLQPHAGGQIYFDLIEKGQGDRVKAKLDCVLWPEERILAESALKEAGVELEDGAVLRCRGGPNVWPAGGRLQFRVAEVDPLFSLGALAKRRRETLRALQAEGLLERNKRLPMSRLPLAIGLVTSVGSAAHADFQDTLRKSGFGFRIHSTHVAVQGAAAEAQIERAIKLLGSVGYGGRRLDAIALIRGGGSRSDLAPFDSRRVSRAVALSRVPVVCGVGHQIDEAISDLVAHTSCKTPTEAADFFVRRVMDASFSIEKAARALAHVATEHLHTVQMRLSAVPQRLGAPARALLSTSSARHGSFERDVRRAAERRLFAARQSVAGGLRVLRDQLIASVPRAQLRLHVVAARLPSPSRRLLATSAIRYGSLQDRVSSVAKRTVTDSQQALERAEETLRIQVRTSLSRSDERLRFVALRLPGPSRRVLATQGGSCDAVEVRLRGAARRLLVSADAKAHVQRERFQRTARQPIRRASERVEAQGRLCEQLSPERTLLRGFSLTRRVDGQLVRSFEDVEAGTELVTQVSNGTIESTVHGAEGEKRKKDQLNVEERR